MRKSWTDEEVEKLEEMLGSFTIESIAKSLGRSFDSVNLKVNRLGLQGFIKTTDFLSTNQVVKLIGVSARTLNKKWVNNGLKIINKGHYRMIRQEDLIRYMKNHPDHWNAKNIADDTIFRPYSWFQDKKKTDTKKSYHWSEHDKSLCKLMFYQGYSIQEISEKIGRSVSACKYMIYKKPKGD